MHLQKRICVICEEASALEYSFVWQAKDSAWGEPKNKNPLEKTTLSRQGVTAQSKEMKDEEEVSPSLIVSVPYHARTWRPQIPVG